MFIFVTDACIGRSVSSLEIYFNFYIIWHEQEEKLLSDQREKQHDPQENQCEKQRDQQREKLLSDQRENRQLDDEDRDLHKTTSALGGGGFFVVLYHL